MQKKRRKNKKPDLSYTLNIDKKENTFYVRAQGIHSLASVKRITEEILEASRKYGIRKALIDVRKLEGKLSTMETFEFVTKNFPKIRKMRILNKVAILDKKEARPRYEFLETVAVNSSYNIRIFENEQKAIKWLE